MVKEIENEKRSYVAGKAGTKLKMDSKKRDEYETKSARMLRNLIIDMKNIDETIIKKLNIQNIVRVLLWQENLSKYEETDYWESLIKKLNDVADFIEKHPISQSNKDIN